MLHLKRIGLFTALLSVSAGALAQDEVAQGQKQFEAQCAACHTVKPGVNGFGPSLAGVVGHAAGKAPGYTYTAAMANSGLTWDEKTLDAFLTSTTQKLPGTSMPVALPDANVRSAIIAYLKSVSAASTAAPAPVAAATTVKPSGGPTQDELTRAASSTRDWLYASKDYSGRRFVKLSQINTKNAHDLRPVCIYRSDSRSSTRASCT